MEVFPLPLNTFEIKSKSSVSSSFLGPAISEKASGPTISDHFSIDLSEDVSSTTISNQSHLLTVPPTTPALRYSFCHVIESPKPFPKVDNLKVPYIREVGIKTSLDILSEHFSCPDYKLNPVQFWFLDVIADCLWQMQDEFQFPERYQKRILEWVLYVFDLIRDPQKNLTRKEFFHIFNETLELANQKIDAGCEMLPLPQELFTVEDNEESEIISYNPTQSDYNSSASELPNGKSYLAVGVDESVEVFQIPKRNQECNKLSSVSTTTVEESEENICESEETIQFYQADYRIPERFLSSSSPSEDSSEENEEEDNAAPPETRLLWKPSTLSSEKIKRLCSFEKFQLEKAAQKSQSGEASKTNIQEEWKEYLEDRHDFIENMEKNMMINSCVLFAIKQFIYEYFHESFQYKIVKLTLINQFSAITQSINKKWYIPKVLKEELKKPKAKKEKKKKKKKPKKPRKKTKAKKKRDKKKKKKKDKKKGKKGKQKKKKLTKEEKAELARLKREQARLEEELRKAEENRRMLFPLKEATNDDFFKSIFAHWVKPKAKKGKGKKGKGKGKRKK